MRCLYLLWSLACALAVLVAPPSACGKVIYVDHNAPGPVHDGATWGTSYPTLDAALSGATSGDELWVAEGTYTGGTSFGSNSMALYGGFSGTETERDQRDWMAHPTVLDGRGQRTVVFLRASVLDGFTIRNSAISKEGVSVSGPCTLANNTITGNGVGVHVAQYGQATLIGNRITGNDQDGVDVFGTATLTENVIADNGDDGVGMGISTAALTGSGNTISGNRGYGVNATRGDVRLTGNVITGNNTGVRSERSATLTGNVISGNFTTGAVVYNLATLTGNTIAGNGHHGLAVFGATTVTNNTICRNGDSGIAVYGTTRLSNNIVAFNEGPGVHERPYSGVILTFSHNDVYGNTGGDYQDFPDRTGVDGNISADPKLSNLFHNVHIQPDSPCRDAGDDSVVASGDTDVDGQPRILGHRVDIGADESDGAVWPDLSRTWHVSPSGDDANDGLSWATAKRTVEGGISVARGSDEVWVAGGTYREQVKPPAGVALFGGFAGAETVRNQRDWKTNVTVLEYDGLTGVVQCRAAGSLVDGFTVRNLSRIQAANGIRVLGTATVANNLITGCDRSGVVVEQGSVASILRNTFSRNGTGVTISRGRASLVGNIIAGNGAGVSILGSGQSAALSSTLLRGNTITGNNSGVYVSEGTVSMANNIIAFNGGYGVVKSNTGSIAAFTHNDVFGNETADVHGFPDPAGTDGNISADPKLSNIYHDAHIQPDSPCRDAGDDSVVASGDTDVDGQPRILGHRVDIGADESDGAVWPDLTRTWHVSPSGDDANDGLSWATAKRTVEGGLSVARGSDEVWVAGGTYYETVDLPAGVGLFGGFAGTETARDQRRLRSVRTALEAYVMYGSIATCRFSGCVLDGFTIRVIQSGRGVTTSGGMVTVANNQVDGDSYGIYVDQGTARLTGNVITRSSAGVYVSQGRVTLTCNTIVLNLTGVFIGGGLVTLANNIVSFNNSYGIQNNTSLWTALVSHNNVFGNGSGSSNYSGMVDPTGIDGNLSQDPMLVSKSEIFTLKPESPCIDAGDDAMVRPGDTDRDGHPRILGTHVDIGAHEFDPSAPLFTLADVSRCLGIAGGLFSTSPAEAARLDVEPSGTGPDLRDAARIARKALWLDANP